MSITVLHSTAGIFYVIAKLFGNAAEKATEMDADYIHGHYAKITHKPLKLYRGKDRNKDQSYFLLYVN